ncbi:hypothetical protein Tco_1430713 [Tanacetum coccineum]
MVSLVQDECIYWIPQEEEVHEKPSDETEVLVQEETPTEIIKEHGSGEKEKHLQEEEARDKQGQDSFKRDRRKRKKQADYYEEKDELGRYQFDVMGISEDTKLDPEQDEDSLERIKPVENNTRKKYPLTKETLQKMLNWKLEAEAESSMAFELLKFIKTQIEDQ